MAIFILNGIYRLFWPCRVRDKIVFISRESDLPSTDILRLTERIHIMDPKVQTVSLCKMIPKGMIGKIGYGLHMFRQMYHMATARVVVLDTYCIAASVLHHKKDLTIIQMWHAVGCMKKFGYSILDKQEGSSSRIAKAMHMHQNYDRIFASGDACIPYLADAYHTTREKFVVAPLPRLDILTRPEEREQNRAKILAVYPELPKKKTILYVPTFRKHTSSDEAVGRLIQAMDLQKYNFVIKYHPILQKKEDRQDVIADSRFTSMEWMSVCDYVITDYSAAVFEAAAAKKPIIFYAYDLDEYEKDRSFYIDYKKEMPGRICQTAGEVAEAVEGDRCDLQAVRDFAEKYVKDLPDYTGHAAAIILASVTGRKE